MIYVLKGSEDSSVTLIFRKRSRWHTFGAWCLFPGSVFNLMMYCCCSTCATFCCNFMLLISAGSQPRSQETRHSSQSAKPTATPGQRPCFGASSTLTTGRISPHLASVLAHRRSLKYLVTAPHLVLMVQHSRRAVVLLRTGSGQALCRVCRLDLRLTPIQID